VDDLNPQQSSELPEDPYYIQVMSVEDMPKSARASSARERTMVVERRSSRGERRPSVSTSTFPASATKTNRGSQSSRMHRRHSLGTCRANSEALDVGGRARQQLRSDAMQHSQSRMESARSVKELHSYELPASKSRVRPGDRFSVNLWRVPAWAAEAEGSNVSRQR